jgi:hypothetical protein
VISHPTSAWVIQQLREAFPYDSAPGYLIFDRCPQFNGEVTEIVRSLGIESKRTSFKSPWQNGIAKRWVGTCRRDLLDHVIVLNERHLKRLMKEYVRYYLEDCTHLALEKETPAGREARETPGVGHEVTLRMTGGRSVPGIPTLYASPLFHSGRQSPNSRSRVDSYCQNHHQVGESGPFRSRLAFWRGTGTRPR